jgi:hypothetical protein
MDSVKSRKILAVVLLTLAVLLFAASSIDLIKMRLSLPSTYTMQNEGKFVAFGLEKLLYLFTLPVVISLLIGAYLIYPSKFEKFSKVAKIIFSLLAIVGFGIAITLITMSIINNFREPNLTASYVFQSILMTFPFWMMGIFSLLAFKKDKFEETKNSYKLGVVLALTAIVALSAAYILFHVLVH